VTHLGHNAGPKAHVVALDEGAAVALSVYDSELHGVTRLLPLLRYCWVRRWLPRLHASKAGKGVAGGTM
jgi:hypothetical protein